MKSNGDQRVAHSNGEFARLACGSSEQRYILRLYITGLTPRSTQATEIVKAICEEYLTGRYDLEVIDIYQQPWLAREEQIIAAPTLVKQLPLPERRLIGDMRDKKRVLRGLNL